MTRLERGEILNVIMRENQFSILDRDNCHMQNEKKIEAMTEIFRLKESSDFTYLYAVADLLSDEPQDVKSYLISENQDCKFLDKIAEPEKDDFLLVATSFEDNIDFFSMAWNWISLVEARVEATQITSIEDKTIIYGITQHIEYLAAATSGWKLIGDENGYMIPANIGKLFIRGSAEELRIEFVASINTEFVNKDFELEISFRLGNEDVRRSVAIIHCAGEEYKTSEVIENVEIQKGIYDLTLKFTPKD